MAGWELVAVAPLTMHRSNRLANMYVLSPFVWRDGELFHLLVRAVPQRDDEPRLKMAEIWHGVSRDGHHFDMETAPVIFPGPDLVDLDGCEDPTVWINDRFVRVWYSGYNEKQKTGRLLLARGPDLARLAKAGLAIDSTPEFLNPKEATVVPVRSGGWQMYFEYTQGGASIIGQATTDDLDGPWRALMQAPLTPRSGGWDGWHMSPGPMVDQDTATPTMFYNGATQSACWRIGWASFDTSLKHIVDRCKVPLIEPETPLSKGASNIAFAASAVEMGNQVLLYFSQSDQDLRCATLRPV